MRGYSGDAAGHCFMLTLTCGNGRDQYGPMTRPQKERGGEGERISISNANPVLPIPREHRFGNGLKYFWIKDSSVQVQV